MILYLAGIPSDKKMLAWVEEYNKRDYVAVEPVGILCTFNQPKLFLRVAYDFDFKNIMLDSGAFSVFNSGGERTIDIDDLCDFIKDHREKITVPVALDVIDDPTGEKSLRNWDYMRDVRGVDAVPTFHSGEPWEVLRYYCDNTDYICFGGVAGQGVKWRDIVKVLERIYNEYPDVKIHTLGINDFHVLQRFPIASCDALTWRNGSRFIQIVTPFGRYHLGPTRINWPKLRAEGVDVWLKNNYNIDLPFPDDFNLRELDYLNLEILYREGVMYARENSFDNRQAQQRLF